MLWDGQRLSIQGSPAAQRNDGADPGSRSTSPFEVFREGAEIGLGAVPDRVAIARGTTLAS